MDFNITEMYLKIFNNYSTSSQSCPCNVMSKGRTTYIFPPKGLHKSRSCEYFRKQFLKHEVS